MTIKSVKTSQKTSLHTYSYYICATIHDNYICVYTKGVLTVIPYHQKGHKCFDRSGPFLQIWSYIYIYIYIYIFTSENILQGLKNLTCSKVWSIFYPIIHRRQETINYLPTTCSCCLKNLQ